MEVQRSQVNRTMIWDVRGELRREAGADLEKVKVEVDV
jgi:hypothetical protein